MDGKPTRFEDLKLLPGQPMQLEFEGYSNERDRSLLVGFFAGHGMIVTNPIKNGSPLPVKNEMELAVRFFAAQLNSACAFRTRILHVARIPYAHLHLALPEKLILGEVRGSVRAKVSLICSVVYGTDQEHKASAKICDISLGGSRIYCASLPVEEGQEIKVVAQITVSGIDRIITLTGIVRSLLVEEVGVTAGVQFTEMSDSDRITLHAYVLSNLAP